MALDAITVVGSAVLATLYELHAGPAGGARAFGHGTLIYGQSMRILLLFLFGFIIALMIASKLLHLYSPKRLTSILHEQRLSLQACLTSGLLLAGTLYLVNDHDIPRSIVLITVGLVALLLSLRRFAYRALLYYRYTHGMGKRNVLIVGNGPEALALVHHLNSMCHLGYDVKGFGDFSGSSPHFTTASGKVVDSLGALFQHVRMQFVDEIFFTAPWERRLIQNALDQAQIHGVDLRLVPDLYDGLAGIKQIEHIGWFPTIPLYCRHGSEMGLLLKRVFDIVLSISLLIFLSPLLLIIAVAVKLDSPGPVLYSSERIGKKGRAFLCVKFRTMVRDADKLRAGIMHMNERDGVLFKISNDPRVTRVGRFLRRYSLDELPQFYNVLKGEMSAVGPRPPIASEVKEYKLCHLRRLEVTPGITGMWQVEGRKDPSFASYVSLDMTYINNWSLWLDFKIIVRTVGVVFAGTGS